MRVTLSGLEFSAAHFLAGHPTCGCLHGHNYRVELECEGEPGPDGMVADFHALRQAAEDVIGELDHRTLLAGTSTELDVKLVGEEAQVSGSKSLVLPRADVAVLPVAATTVEELVRYLHRRLRKRVPSLVRVRLWENERSSATYPGKP